MPIYEYECEECHEVTEAWQSLSDAPMTVCPSCSGHMKKLISISSFQLKGGGWYADGYNGSSNNKSCPSSSSCKTKSTDKTKATPPSCPKDKETACCAA